MQNPSEAIFRKLADALNNVPSKQPVRASNTGVIGANDQKKANSKIGMGNTKIKNKGAFNPNKSYSVSVINKAKAKIG